MLNGKALPRYSEWLEFVFGRTKTPNGWYFDCDDVVFDAEDAELALLIAHTFRNCGTDLAGFSDAQVNDGLIYIFDCSCSDVAITLMSDTVDESVKLSAISSIKYLYRDCLGPRCAPVLGHKNEPTDNPLNYICYMLWDITPLASWEGKSDRERSVFFNAVTDVLEDALSSGNPACVESALHGLGHILVFYKDRCTEVIERYLRVNPSAPSSLKAYARRASTGHIL